MDIAKNDSMYDLNEIRSASFNEKKRSPKLEALNSSSSSFRMSVPQLVFDTGKLVAKSSKFKSKDEMYNPDHSVNGGREDELDIDEYSNSVSDYVC